jgi:prolyl-tRNA synthetase
LNEAKLMARTGATNARPATPEECVATLGAKPGSLGAVVNVPTEVEVIADEQLRGAKGMTTGANEDGFHFRHIEIDRDVKVSRWDDLRTVKAGELCVATGQSLKIRRAIEVGHVFKLGTRYSEKLNALFLDDAGQQHPCVMGCYGIGITRTLQAVIEQCHDKDGIIWPVSVAPFTVCITALNVAPDGPIMQLATKIYDELSAGGIDVILDDRDERPGVKFKDADLIGIPVRITIGDKGLAEGKVEIKARDGSNGPKGELVPVETAVARVLELLKSL